MSQWREVNSICQENQRFYDRVKELYDRLRIPYKIRSEFAEWIEDQDWSSSETNRCKALFNELLRLVKNREDIFKQTQSFQVASVMDLTDAANKLKKTFTDDYRSFATIWEECLNGERVLLQSNNAAEEELPRKSPRRIVTDQGGADKIRDQLDELLQQILQGEELARQINMEQEKFRDISNTHSDQLMNLEAQAQHPGANLEELNARRERLIRDLNLNRQKLIDRCIHMAQAHINLAIRLATLLHLIWGEIKKWQNDQKRVTAGLQKDEHISLDPIESLCEEGGKLLLRMILGVEEAFKIFSKSPCERNYSEPVDKLTALEMVLRELKQEYLNKHLETIFVVEENVHRKCWKKMCRMLSYRESFEMTVRFLGGKGLGLGFERPSIQMSLVSETELENDVLKPTHSSTVDVNSSGQCKAAFRNLRVENILPQSEASRLTNVQKAFFVFNTQLKIHGCDIPIKMVSHLVILISEPEQEVIAKGLLIWDAAFPGQNRKIPKCKSEVPWAEVASMISCLFENNTGRGLMHEHLQYLERLLPSYRSSNDHNVPRIVTEKQFILLPVRDFSLWTWIWANMSVVKDLVNGEWNAGLIYGFISKEEARSKLIQMKRGTFLLRFSETNIRVDKEIIYGCLTIAVRENDLHTGGPKLYYVKDYLSPQEIKQRGLTEILDAMEIADSKKKKVPTATLR